MENEGETVNLSTSKSRNNEPTKSQTNLVEFDSSEDETRKTIQYMICSFYFFNYTTLHRTCPVFYFNYSGILL